MNEDSQVFTDQLLRGNKSQATLSSLPNDSYLQTQDTS